jgi:pimeloyl-ACP methyl ester carboxylesterase
MTGRPVAAVLSVALAVAAAPALAEEVVTIETRPGVTQSFVLVEPAGKPVAGAILLPGGNGKMGLWRNPDRRTNNFLVRARQRFAAGGVLVAVVDVPSDRRRPGLSGWRDSEEHRADMAAVAQWLRRKAAIPVWLVGTSRGTVSAAHLGAHLPVGGVVLTSSVTRSAMRNPATALDAPLGSVRVPVLLVAHRQDGCTVTPAEGVNDLKAALAASPRVEIMLFDGGDPPRSGPCQALSEHGFLGIEDRVVDAIAGWMRARGNR